jgi:hypothetical protein
VTPGSENAGRRAVRRLCDEFAVSEAAREADIAAQSEVHVWAADGVSQGSEMLWTQEFPVRISPETTSHSIEDFVLSF